LDEKPMVSFCFVFWWPYRFCKQATTNFWQIQNLT
jgi:hypothetical protein